MPDTSKPQTDTEALPFHGLLALVIGRILSVILGSLNTNPGNPAVAEALNSLNEVRLGLHAEAKTDPVKVHDPNQILDAHRQQQDGEE